MSVESFLTRELDVRFIDARNIVSEAKVNLGITGYPTTDQQRQIRDESLRVFHDKPYECRQAMTKLHFQLEAVKNPVIIRRASSSSHNTTTTSTRFTTTTAATTTTTTTTASSSLSPSSSSSNCVDSDRHMHPTPSSSPSCSSYNSSNSNSNRRWFRRKSSSSTANSNSSYGYDDVCTNKQDCIVDNDNARSRRRSSIRLSWPFVSSTSNMK